MKTRILPALLAVFITVLAPASAAIITYTPLTSFDVPPGATITFQISGRSVNDIGGFSLYLNSSATGAYIQLTAYTLNTALFTYGGPGPTFPETISSTENSQDLGAFSLGSPPLVADTTYLLGIATITIDPLTPVGTYTISNTSTTVFTDPTFTLSDYATVSDFTIHVVAVPEPFTGALLLAGCLVVVLARKNSHALA
ncbi:MAG: hypothetical protein ACREKL_08365 [Chthoniobacterales bacterium]